MPNCGGKANGVYPDEKRDCKWYYKCQDERTIMHLGCPKNHMYRYVRSCHGTERNGLTAQTLLVRKTDAQK